MDESRLRAELLALGPVVDEHAAWTALVDKLNRARRRRRALGAAAAVVLAVAIGATIAALPDERSRTDTVGVPMDTSTSRPTDGARWTRVDSAVARIPFAGDPVIEPTSDGLLIWGRTVQVQLDPTTGETRSLPDAPIQARDDAGGAWTGSELIVWGGLQELDGAAYNLADDTWRKIAPSPLRRGSPIATVWTGDEVLIWGGLPGSWNEGAAYDPASDTWRPIADAPLGLSRGNAVQVGQGRIVVLGTSESGEAPVAGQAQAMEYDVATDTWTVLDEPGLSPNATWMVWSGDEIIAWDYELEARRWAPGDESWQPLPDVPLEWRECYPGGGFSPEVGVLVTYCDQVAVLDVERRSWTRQEMPFPIELSGVERELFGPVAQTAGHGLFVLTSDGGLLFR